MDGCPRAAGTGCLSSGVESHGQAASHGRDGRPQQRSSVARTGGLARLGRTCAGQSPAPPPPPDLRCVAALSSLPLSFLSLSSLALSDAMGIGSFGGRCRRGAAAFPARGHRAALFPPARARGAALSPRLLRPRRPPRREGRLGDAFDRKATPYAGTVRRQRRRA